MLSRTTRLIFFLFQFCLLVLFTGQNKSWAQTWADADFYLIDSLDLNELDLAEKNHIDSCLTNYHAAQTDSLKYHIMEKMIEKMRHHVWEEYNDLLYEKARAAANEPDITTELKDHFRKIMAGTINNKGYSISKNGNSYVAVDYYMEANKIFEDVKDSFGMAACYINAATAYYNAGELELSNEMEIQGLNIGLAINDSRIVSTSYGSLAVKYLGAGYFDEALENGLKALDYSKKVEGDRKIELSAHIDLGKIYASMGQDSLAQDHFGQALIISNQHGDIHHILKTQVAYAEFRLEQIEHKETDQAFADSTEKVLLKTLPLTVHNSSRSVRIATFRNLSKFYYLQNDFRQALIYGDSAYFLSKASKDLFRRESATEQRYLALKALGKSKEALAMLEEWVEIQDKLDNDATTQLITQNKMKLQYTVESTKDSLKYAAQQELAAKEIQHQNSQIEADKRQKWILYIGLALIAGISIVLFKKFRQTKTQNELIEDQKSQIEEAHGEMTASIQYAQRLQGALLPPLTAIQNRFPESFVLFKPKDIVSGDFYWFEETEDFTFIAVADCTGHGVPGAMVSVVCNNALNRSLREFELRSTAEILNKTRELVIAAFAKSGEQVKDGMDIALCAIHKKEQTIQFSGANNPLWIVRHKTNEMEAVKGDRQPIGLHSKMTGFNATTLSFEKGDTLYLFSDGYADQFGGEKGKKLKYKPFKQLLLEHHESSPKIQEEKLEDFMATWSKGHPQIDDICIIGIQL